MLNAFGMHNVISKFAIGNFVWFLPLKIVHKECVLENLDIDTLGIHKQHQ